MRLALLANPESGRGQAPDAERLLREHGAEVRRFELDDRDAVVEWGPERIAVAGGDGSIGCSAEAAAKAAVPLAVIPTGTANDFARALDLPFDLDAACRLAVAGERVRRLELAWLGERPFVNAASLGLSPAAARRAHGIKRLLGPLAYSVGALHAGLTARPVACRVGCDGETLFTGSAWQVTIASTGAFGGGSQVEADPHDGRLDVVVIEARSRAWLVMHAYGLRRGRVEAQSGVHSARAHSIEVHAEDGGFNVDGEVVDAEHASFRVEPEAFGLVSG
jgi:diacylglycerol kinase family enzyme